MEIKEFDEDDAIKFIRQYVQSSVKNKYSDDDILLLIDTMYDFYENGDDSNVKYEDESDECNINEIVNYVKKSLRKDPDNQIDMDDVKSLVEGEIGYENTLEEN